MKKLLNVIKPQPQTANAHDEPAGASTGWGTARVRVNDPLAVGIEEFLGSCRFVPLSPPFPKAKPQTNTKTKNENATIPIQKPHQR